MRYAAAVVLDLHTHIRHTSYGAHLSPSPTLLSFASCPLDPFWKKKVSNRRSKATVRTGCFFPLLSLSASNQKNALTASICLLFLLSLPSHRTIFPLMFQQKKKKGAFVVECGFISTVCALKHLAGVIIYSCDVTCFHSSGYICSYLCANVRV